MEEQPKELASGDVIVCCSVPKEAYQALVRYSGPTPNTTAQRLLRAALGPISYSGDSFLWWGDIDHLDLQARTRNTLHRAGIDTVEQLRFLSDDDLRTIRNMGKLGVEDVRQALATHHEKQRKEDAAWRR